MSKVLIYDCDGVLGDTEQTSREEWADTHLARSSKSGAARSAWAASFPTPNS